MCAVSKTAEPYRAWRPCILCLPALVDDSTPPRRGSGNSVFWDNPFSQLAWASALSRQRSIRVRIRRGQNKEPILGISYLACARGICRLVLSLAGPDIPPAGLLNDNNNNNKKKKSNLDWCCFEMPVSLPLLSGQPHNNYNTEWSKRFLLSSQAQPDK